MPIVAISLVSRVGYGMPPDTFCAASRMLPEIHLPTLMVRPFLMPKRRWALSCVTSVRCAVCTWRAYTK